MAEDETRSDSSVQEQELEAAVGRAKWFAEHGVKQIHEQVKYLVRE